MKIVKENQSLLKPLSFTATLGVCLTFGTVFFGFAANIASLLSYSFDPHFWAPLLLQWGSVAVALDSALKVYSSPFPFFILGSTALASWACSKAMMNSRKVIPKGLFSSIGFHTLHAQTLCHPTNAI
jgi:hypothetical protein